MAQQSYSKTAIILHWVTAIVMIGMLVFGEDLIKVARGTSLAGWQPTAHASIGIVVLLLGFARVFWRLGHPAPPMPVTIAGWQVKASHATHWVFYVLMIGIPLMGLFAIVPYGAERLDVEQVTFFKLFSVAVMPNLGEWTGEAHELLSKLAQILVVVHIVAALKHQFWDKDNLMSRMRPM